jgi:hypothetical protein
MVSEVRRTLVKSPPELWAELSDPASLARHLSELGEIQIKRSDPERTVEWSGEGINGAVTLAASGWGTKVTLTAVRELPEPEPTPEPAEPEPEPEPTPEPEPIVASVREPEPKTESRRGFFARLFRRRQEPHIPEALEPEPVATLKPAPAATVEPAPVATAAPEPVAPEQSAPVAEPEPRPDLAAELAAAEELITDQTTAVLTAVLDRLGAAHHRPFSRA